MKKHELRTIKILQKQMEPAALFNLKAELGKLVEGNSKFKDKPEISPVDDPKASEK